MKTTIAGSALVLCASVWMVSSAACQWQPKTASSAAPAVSAAQQPSPPASAELEALFWQSIVNSSDPADFEA